MANIKLKYISKVLLYKKRKFVFHQYGNINNIKIVKCRCRAIRSFIFLQIQFCVK